MDLFAQLRELSSVAKAANVYQKDETSLDLFFFVCPKADSHGFHLNRHHTGFTCRFVNEVAPSSLERFSQVQTLEKELKDRQIKCRTQAVFAAADSLLLFPFPTPPPSTPEVVGFELISNAEIVSRHFDEFVHLYHEHPWQQLTPKVLEDEHQRIASLIHGEPPDNLVTDIVERCFAGFALDGLLARRGYFGPNPVLIAVEGAGVAMLQNCGLARDKWLPTIHLR